jgi:hypothetical protein
MRMVAMLLLLLQQELVVASSASYCRNVSHHECSDGKAHAAFQSQNQTCHGDSGCISFSYTYTQDGHACVNTGGGCAEKTCSDLRTEYEDNHDDAHGSKENWDCEICNADGCNTIQTVEEILSAKEADHELCHGKIVGDGCEYRRSHRCEGEQVAREGWLAYK